MVQSVFQEGRGGVVVEEKGKEGVSRGKRRGQGDRWDVPACLNTVGKKLFWSSK